MRKTLVKPSASGFINYFAHMKPRVFITNVFLLMVLITTAVACTNKKEQLPAKHLEVVLREIGHQLLLTAKDSTSRVLPVKQLHENTYQLSFQHDFSFVSDSLINLVQRTFEQDGVANHYIVNVRNCAQKGTILAFEINKQATDLTPCRGRTLQEACYIIELEFLPSNTTHRWWWLLLLIPLAIGGYYLKGRLRKPAAPLLVHETMDYLPLGRFQLYTGSHVLSIGDKQIPLSAKETKALTLFAQNMHQVVERERLMKEIWEDAGLVVISKNVDVLVSKLRKKLADDPTLKIINIPGKGYKCTVG